jgi:hypothetical protein
MDAVQRLVNTPWFLRPIPDILPTSPSPSGEISQGSYVPPGQRNYDPTAGWEVVSDATLRDAAQGLDTLAIAGTAAIGVAGMAYMAPVVAPEVAAAAADAAAFAETPAGQFLTGYATSQLGSTGLPSSNVYNSIGGHLDNILDLFSETEARKAQKARPNPAASR